jgi:hypothetical protein
MPSRQSPERGCVAAQALRVAASTVLACDLSVPRHNAIPGTALSPFWNFG